MMQSNFLWSTSEQRLYKTQSTNTDGSEQLEQWYRLDPWHLSWTDASKPITGLKTVSALQALLNLKGQLRRLPVGVIGPREASEEELVIATAVRLRLPYDKSITHKKTALKFNYFRAIQNLKEIKTNH